MSDDKISFTAHLEELRKRLIISIVAVVVGFVACYHFAKEIFIILARPLQQALPPNSSLVFINPTEAFLTYLKTAFLAGFFLAIPIILYQVWKFIAPGLYKEERSYVIPFVLSSSILFIGGALFGYFMVFPLAFKFLMGFSSDMIQAFPSMKEYLSFVIKLLIAFGVVFETPVFIFFLAKLGIVNYEMLKAYRKYFLVLAFVIGALLTPPDPLSQIMMAVPLLILYEVSVLVTKYFGKKKVEEEEETKDDEESEEA